MVNSFISSDEIFKQLMLNVAPLPCQDTYARNLASIFSMHLKKNELIEAGFSPEDLPSVSAVVVAPTGQGKTFLVKQMAKALGINAIVIDGSALCHEGWKGVSLSQQLVAAKNAAKDQASFATSVLFIDEIDKLRLVGTDKDVGNAQPNILQLYNGGTIVGEGSNREAESVDISRFTVILGGAFEGLETIIENRLMPKAGIGFRRSMDTQKMSKAELLKQATLPDLASYGLMPELLGRIGSIINIDSMEMEDYRQLLTAEHGSIRRRYSNYLSSLYGVSFEITEAGVKAIAEKCMTSATGARAVNPLINDLMRCAIAEVERDVTINRVLLDAVDGECAVQYEHGPRAYTTFYKKKVEPKLFPYRVKARSIPGMTAELCKIYIDADGEAEVLDELQAFLNCALYFLKYNTNPEDFCFSSLEKLARTVRKGNNGENSTFDIMMTDAIAAAHAPNRQAHYYRAFNAVYNFSSSYRLIMALNLIMTHIQKDGQGTDIRLELAG